MKGRAMLENFQPVPPDPILGLGQLYAADPREGKIDLGVGVFLSLIHI